MTRSGAPCKRPAGWGTRHVREGRCKLHGGRSTGPKDQRGNKNAVVTGEFETIHASELTGEERQLYDTLDITPLAQTRASLRLASIREHRILLRQTRLEAAIEPDADGFSVSQMLIHKGWNVKGKVDFSIVERTPVLATLMRLEESLTRIQRMKTKIIDQLRECIKDAPPETDGLSEIVNAIDRSAQLLVATEEEEGIALDL
jgi:hypothetical protein